jgi:hypothetical protein
MKKIQNIILLSLALMSNQLQAQESEDYIEFNDRQNIVHGVYLGLTFYYGEIDSKSTYMAGAKIAYVANQKFEVGFTGVGFYSDQNSNGPFDNNDIFGGYGGLHLEPILFGDSTVSLSFPILVGGGAVSYSENDFNSTFDYDYTYSEEWDPFFVFEPGVSLMYNISSYLQVEMGVKYRLTSDINLYPGGVNNLNGFSGGIGLKIGVFNLGKKR